MKKTKSKSNKSNVVILWLPVILWAALIFSFSTIKQAKVSDFFFWDYIVKKTAHVTEYAIFYALIFRATKKNWIAAYLLVLLYSASDEFHQHFVIGRTATPLDLGFDLSGANISAYVLWKLKQFRLKKARK